MTYKETDTHKEIEAMFQRINKLEIEAMHIRQAFQQSNLFDLSDRNRSEMFRISQDVDLIARVANNTNERLRLILQETNQVKAKAEVGQ